MNVRCALAQPFQINEAAAAAQHAVRPPFLSRGSSLAGAARVPRGGQRVPSRCHLLWRACFQAWNLGETMPGTAIFPYPPQAAVDHIPFCVITELGKYTSFFFNFWLRLVPEISALFCHCFVELAGVQLKAQYSHVQHRTPVGSRTMYPCTESSLDNNCLADSIQFHLIK